MHNIGSLYYTQIISVSKITANKAKEEQKQHDSNPCTWLDSAVETREANMLACFSTLSEEDNTFVICNRCDMSFNTNLIRVMKY